MNDDEYAMAEPGSEPESDSDFEYEGRNRYLRIQNHNIVPKLNKLYRRGKGKKALIKTRPSRSSRSSRRMEEDMMKTPVSDSE